MENRVYLCIDLKSFYASVESVARGLDPMATNLVVADPSRGTGALCLAITPAMKKLGIQNRCRLFEIPKNVKYITAVPRMKLYMETSAKIYKCYLKYIAKEDIHVYSIDECFIDATKYLKLYHVTAREFTKMLLNMIYDETGLTATAGIGTNLFLAKLALDVTAKKSIDFIGYLNEDIFKDEMWYHEPITDVWNIGPGISRRLRNKWGVTNLHGITEIPEYEMYKEFGINAELIIDHAWGRETCTIEDIHKYKSKSHSVSNSQILFEDYNYKDALLVLKEMVDINSLTLIDKHLVTNNISLLIRYSKDVIAPTAVAMKLDGYTQSRDKLMTYFVDLYKKCVNPDFPIRGIGIGFNNVCDEINESYDLFTDIDKLQKEKRVQETLINLKNKYGKNVVVKAMDLEEKATTIKRNKLIGGHNATEDDQS